MAGTILSSNLAEMNVQELLKQGCKTVEVADATEANEYILNAGISDGLPIIVPTSDAVAATIEAGGRAPDSILGEVPQRQRSVTVLQAATCAVMAGAKPEYFPVILATWDAVLDPAYGASSSLSSTGGAGITAVVSGPYGQSIKMNSGAGLLGPGNRANATIGRAVRLAAIGALGAKIGVLDASSFSHGGKYSAHFLEDEPAEPWTPLRVREGFSLEDTTVTVVPTDGPKQIFHGSDASAEAVLRTFATCMRDASHVGAGRRNNFLIVMGPEHADVLRSAGVSQEQIVQFLAAESRVSVEELTRAGIGRPDQSNPDLPPDVDGLYVTAPPEKIRVVTAGGVGPGWSLVMPGWAGAALGAFVTKPVRIPS
jgi:hypothetical protein